MANLPLLDAYTTMVDGNGRPTTQILQFWQQFAEAILQNIDDSSQALEQAIAAINAALAANDIAVDAQNTANAAQSTADGKLDQTTADARYVRQDQTASWFAPTGTASRLSFATYTAPGASASYDQTQINALMTAVQNVSQALGYLIPDLQSNGTLS